MIKRIVAVLMLLLAASACSSSGEGSANIAAPAPSTTLAVQVHEFGFEPSVLAIPAGQQVSVTVKNQGTIKHEWVVVAKGHELSLQRDFDESAVLYEVDEVAPGTQNTGSFSITEPGRYQLICAIEGHFNAGMRATLVVT